ncbi:ATP-binding protein [Actinomadura algeriensis]|uniref:Anti-sigma regulatory factor (Ser/Thr protein kinase) n=1 Tax=Actinomadura algeriensis TaxID=1679523 RepID=A0ABR9JJ49_9ACTN|nr:ATP-binding protein [Actinomadura algeriensis]MBE1530572.1 anti-sigma regulatory factor (Ser/Thr protein kinase) [Actinomadura algeriensis]
MSITATGDLIIPLLGTPSAVGLARTLAGARLNKWNCRHISDDALLIVSELVTNAARQTSHQEIRLQVSRDTAGIVVAVWDASPEIPKSRPVPEVTLDDLDVADDAFDDNGGRGLPLVQALSHSCGVTKDPTGGKWIWARLSP